MAGYPVARVKADELEGALKQLKSEFEVELQAFLDNYDQALREWAAAQPQWAHALQEATSGLELQCHLNSSLSRPSLVA